MHDVCRVESYSAKKEGKHFITLPERIWQRDDLLLVAAGSLACVRTLYLRAAGLHKLHQFVPCPLTPADYAGGHVEERLTTVIREAVRRPGVGCVIIYASCAEILSQCDLEHVAEQLGFLEQIPIRFLLRGPLVARRRNTVRDLDCLLEELPPPTGSISPAYVPTPVLPPDFSGASSLFQNWDAYPFLLTAGGCTGCLTLGDGISQELRLDYSRFDDVELATGCESSAVNGIAEGFQRSGASFCGLMGSAIPEMIGMDYGGIQARLTAQGIPTLLIPCTGFEAAQVGINQALLKLCSWIQFEGNLPNLVHILGYSDLALGSQRPLQSGIAALNTLGYQVCLWDGRSGASGTVLPALHWVVTAEGLRAAQWMEAKYGIPYLCGLPLEEHGQSHWLAQLSKADNTPDSSVRNTGKVPNLLLVGQPMTTEGLSWAISGRWPTVHIQRAFYAPTKGLKELFRPFLGPETFLFSSPEELAAQVQKEPELLLADPLFFPCLVPQFPNAKLLSCPDPTIGGRGSLPATWLEKPEPLLREIEVAIENITI